jgi:hypothetical protein
MSHSPLPWKVQKDGGFLSIRHGNQSPIANVGFANRAEHRANAEFIVNACNSHDMLIYGLRLALDALDRVSLPSAVELAKTHGEKILSKLREVKS